MCGKHAQNNNKKANIFVRRKKKKKKSFLKLEDSYHGRKSVRTSLTQRFFNFYFCVCVCVRHLVLPVPRKDHRFFLQSVLRNHSLLCSLPSLHPSLRPAHLLAVPKSRTRSQLIYLFNYFLTRDLVPCVLGLCRGSLNV